MIAPLYDHQHRIIKEDRKWAGFWLGTGAAKTRTALEMAEGSVLVVCPKQQREDKTWQINAEKFDIITNMKVISYEDLRRDWESLDYADTIIFDEAHRAFGVTADTRQRKGIEIPKTSQIFEAALNLLRKNPPKRFYMCTATPISKPMNLWAIAILMGEKWDFFDFRAKYYTAVRIGQRRVWLPKTDKDTKDRLADLLKQFGYTGTLNDFFDVPEQTHKTVKIDLGEEQKAAVKEMMRTEADPLVRRARLRTIENGVLYGKRIEEISEKEDKMVEDTIIFPSKKIDYILERAEEFPKLLVFAQYTAQIRQIYLALKEAGFNVSELTGQTKDRTFVKKVEESPAPHVIVAQSSISSGYELPSFPCVVFASKSWQYLHYEQGLGRVLRSNKLKKNLYIHLVVEGCDEDCHNAIMSGQDFQERLTMSY